MNRRSFLGFVTAISTIPLVKGHSKETLENPIIRVPETGLPKHSLCKWCGKKAVSIDTHLVETTARNTNSNYRTYDVAGVTFFHADGTRCSGEYLEYTKLERPIVHKDLKL